MRSPAVVQVERLSLQYAPQPWPFACDRRSEIDAHFARAQQERPALWNGQVLVMHRHRFDRGGLEGAFLSTDFASFLSWRDWGFPDAGVVNCFSMGALRAGDGAWLMGVMGAHTAGAGLVYFPAGTPDPDDVIAGEVDLAGSVIREVAEETGLVFGDYTAAPAWHAVIDGARIALIKVLQAHETAEVLRGRILEHLARESMPELADMRIVRAVSDLEAAMPRFVTAFVHHIGFGHRGS